MLAGNPYNLTLFEAFFECSLFGATNEFRKKFIDLGWYPMWEVDGKYRFEVYHLIKKDREVKKREIFILFRNRFSRFQVAIEKKQLKCWKKSCFS